MTQESIIHQPLNQHQRAFTVYSLVGNWDKSVN